MITYLKMNSHSKYNAKKTVIENITFSSRKEASRYQELKLLEDAGEISDLQLQKVYELIPKGKGERSAKYLADFVYREAGKVIVEDCKGFRTRDYILKRKLMKWLYPELIFRES